MLEASCLLINRNPLVILLADGHCVPLNGVFESHQTCDVAQGFSQRHTSQLQTR